MIFLGHPLMPLYTKLWCVRDIYTSESALELYISPRLECVCACVTVYLCLCKLGFCKVKGKQYVICQL